MSDLQIHPRYFIVAEACNSLSSAIFKIADRKKLTIKKIMDPLLQIALATNQVADLNDRKAVKDLGAAGIEIMYEVFHFENKHDLTAAESLKNLLEIAQSVQKYAIRHERHPGETDTKGDEA